MLFETTNITQKAIIEVVNISKTFRAPKSYAQLLCHPFKVVNVTVLDRINFSVSQGECLGILGPNGAGKTTLMKILSTLIRPTAGEVLIDGFNVEEDPIRVKENIGCVVNDERSFFWRLTGLQNLQFFATLNNIPKKTATEIIEQLVDLVGLTLDIQKSFQYYSSGMKQKLAIARALLTDPRILILDEPSRNLDPLFTNSFHTFLKETILGQMKKTVLLATNNVHEAEYLCDRITFLNRGKVLLHTPMQAGMKIEEIFNTRIPH